MLGSGPKDAVSILEELAVLIGAGVFIGNAIDRERHFLTLLVETVQKAVSLANPKTIFIVQENAVGVRLADVSPISIEKFQSRECLRIDIEFPNARGGGGDHAPGLYLEGVFKAGFWSADAGELVRPLPRYRIEEKKAT